MKAIFTILTMIWLIILAGNKKPEPFLHAGPLSNPVNPDTQEKTRYVYIGAAKCASSCHNSDSLGHQYNAWKSSLHARAWQSLTTRKAFRYAQKAGITGDPDESRDCLKCHITAAEADAASISNTYRKEDGVTCEACHKRELNPATYIPKEEDCLKCHNSSVHKVPRFNFDKSSEKISHPRPGMEQK
jgi:hypothetical protein